MMKLIRCRICGDTYLGTGFPSRCPFCGAKANLMVDASEFPPNINDVELTDVERADLEHAVGLEYSNSRFYLAMAEREPDGILSSAYKRLAKVETEHLSVFSKLLKAPKPADYDKPSEKGADWCVDIADSNLREHTARDFYRTAAERAVSPRVKEVFAAVADVENDHIELDALTAQIAQCEK